MSQKREPSALRTITEIITKTMEELIFIGTIACFTLLMIFLYVRAGIYERRINSLVNQTKYLIYQSKCAERRSLHNSYMMLSFVLEYAKEHEKYESCKIIQDNMNEIQKQIVELDKANM